MRKNIAVIPKKTKVQIMGCSYELIDSVRVKGKQKYLNQALKAQTDFYNGVGIVSESPEKTGYAWSNRYRLQQAIKKTGFHAEKLSLASNHAKTYFTGFTAESRFNSRGDITEERLNALLTTLAFAERELLGVGAKTVDYIETSRPIEFFGHGELRVLEPIDDTIPKADEKGSKFVDCSFNPAQNSLGNHCNQMGLSNNPCQVSKSMRNGYPYYSVSNPVKEALDDLHEIREKQEKKLIDEKSENLKKVLIAFLFVVVLLALWFLFK